MASGSASGEALRKPPAPIETGAMAEQAPQVETPSHRDS